ncbi:MAG TPA: MBL fold metallo-hydrolase, partial [Saccharofermentans sp.]|nr:MBL fold metallo-hydrolase [Saccharofermentans sp.]
MITILPFGPLQSNMYILSNSNGYIIIDPCVGVDLTTSYLSSFSVENVKAVIMTHAHFDHLMYVDEWRSALHDDVPFYLSHEDVPLLKDANLNRSQNRGLSQEYVVETLDVCHM